MGEPRSAPSDGPGPRRPVILHVDLDAFYAAVEILADPSLAGKPVVVGGTGARGVVAAASYEARACGVHSAMPSARACRLCPSAVFLAGHFDVYADYTRRLHEILTCFTPLVEGIALDEAFLDVRSVRRLWGTGPQIADRVRLRVRDELGLWASVGVGTTKLVAKLASEAAKPTPLLAGPVPGPGVKVVPPEEELAFLHAHPVGALWGVGPATRRRLDRFGVATVGDLARLPVEALVGALGPALGRSLHDLAQNRDPRPVVPDRAPKSIGHEETYPRDHHDPEPLRREVVRLAEAVVARLRGAGFAGRTVTLKVRFGDFRTITRSRTEPEAVGTGPALAAVALALLDGVDVSPGVRLLGVSASNLVPATGRQLTLEELVAAGDRSRPSGHADRPLSSDQPDRQEAVARAVDAARRRFGDRVVGPASLVGKNGVEIRRQGDRQWGPEV
ncbi:MAG TPA: DNA polymerase IV [Acidimicrobiales bacterium]|nr:DNA polymerase IV [Acidimicrobiales bacterium]